MAFQPPSAQRELTNRKILEELQLKKQLLLKQGVASSLGTNSLIGSPTSVTNDNNHNLSPVQRAALQSANTQSTGYFITQDSSFGNFILPVLPRLENSPKL